MPRRSQPLASVLAAALAALLFTAAARADDKPAAPAPGPARPAAELAGVDFLHGHFTCAGTWHSDTGASIKKHSTFKSEWKLGKHFLTFEYDQAGTKEQPNHIAAVGYFGWDAGQKKFVHNAINNQGLSVTLYAEAGGEGLSFKGEGSAATGASARRPVSFSFKPAPKGFTITTVVERDGKSVTISEETCTK